MIVRIISTLLFINLFSAFSYAQSVSASSGMNFGLIEFAANHDGELSLGTNGGVSLTGTGLFYQGNAVPGQFTINGTSGTVEVRCETTASLGETGGGTALQVRDIELSANIGVAANAGSPCHGAGGASPITLSVDLSATANPRVYIGGTLIIPSNALNGGKTYRSSNSGGSPITISTIFQ